MMGFAADFSLLGGYYAPLGFVAAELGFDWFVSIHVQHSDPYRRTVYEDVQDGWYATPGGNVHAGAQGGVTFGRVDVTLRVAHDRDIRFESTLLPFVATAGVNVHW